MLAVLILLVQVGFMLKYLASMRAWELHQLRIQNGEEPTLSAIDSIWVRLKMGGRGLSLERLEMRLAFLLRRCTIVAEIGSAVTRPVKMCLALLVRGCTIC